MTQKVINVGHLQSYAAQKNFQSAAKSTQKVHKKSSKKSPICKAMRPSGTQLDHFWALKTTKFCGLTLSFAVDNRLFSDSSEKE